MALIVVVITDEDDSLSMKVFAEPAIPNGDDEERTPAQSIARGLIYAIAEEYAG